MRLALAERSAGTDIHRVCGCAASRWPVWYVAGALRRSLLRLRRNALGFGAWVALGLLRLRRNALVCGAWVALGPLRLRRNALGLWMVGAGRSLLRLRRKALALGCVG